MATNLRSFQHDYQETGISKELLRTSLADALAADDLLATNALLGNRVAVLHVQPRSTWICQQSGQIGELLSVSRVLSASDLMNPGSKQVRHIRRMQMLFQEKVAVPRAHCTQHESQHMITSASLPFANLNYHHSQVHLQSIDGSVM